MSQQIKFYRNCHLFFLSCAKIKKVCNMDDNFLPPVIV